MAILINDKNGRYYHFELEDLVFYRLSDDLKKILTESDRGLGKDIIGDAIIVEDHVGEFYRIPNEIMDRHAVHEEELPAVLENFEAKYVTRKQPSDIVEIAYDCGPKWY